MDGPSPDTRSSEGHRRTSRWRAVWVNLTFFAFALPGTLILALVAVAVSWIPPRGNGMLFIARAWSRCLLAAAGVRVEVEMHPRLRAAAERGDNQVYMANHASYMDIPALLTVIPTQVRFAAKRSLFSIPIFGWSLWAGGFIPVDRKNRARARDAFAIAVRRLRGGASVLFFPEGTRSHDGGLGTFERGGFLLAIKSGVPVVPVGVEGTYGVMPRHRLTVRPGRVTVRLGEPVPTAGLGVRDRGELEREVRSEIARLSGQGAAARDVPEAGVGEG